MAGRDVDPRLPCGRETRQSRVHCVTSFVGQGDWALDHRGRDGQACPRHTVDSRQTRAHGSPRTAPEPSLSLALSFTKRGHGCKYHVRCLLGRRLDFSNGTEGLQITQKELEGCGGGGGGHGWRCPSLSCPHLPGAPQPGAREKETFPRLWSARTSVCGLGSSLSGSTMRGRNRHQLLWSHSKALTTARDCLPGHSP